VRLEGTNADLARQRLARSMPQVLLADDLSDAAIQAVEAVARETTESDSPTSDASGKLWRKMLNKLTDTAH